MQKELKRQGLKDNSPITVGFVGNPNCGKTTLFNAFTGASTRRGFTASLPTPSRRLSPESALRMKKWM